MMRLKGLLSMQQRRSFDVSLQEVRSLLLDMGTKVQIALRTAMDALVRLDIEVAQQVVDGDRLINRREHEIEDLCIGLIARQQPVATDLRKLVAGLRISADLERMADLAVDVAKQAIRLEGQQLTQPLGNIVKMAEMVNQMISDALAAYVSLDTQVAQRLAEEDDEVDHLYREIVEELFTISKDDSNQVSLAMSFAFVGRYLERIGDHATNIGESVIYISSGERSDLN